MHKQWCVFFIKVLKTPRSYDFLKQIELFDIVDNMQRFQESPQQSMINEIVPICKLLLVNPATIAAGKGPFQQLEGWNLADQRGPTKGGSEQPQGENGQTFQVNETRENYDAAVHCYTFLLLGPLSFVWPVKESDWWVATV